MSKMKQTESIESLRAKQHREAKLLEYAERTEDELRVYEECGFSREEAFLLLLNRTLSSLDIAGH